jgi:hypothetical protein
MTETEKKSILKYKRLQITKAILSKMSNTGGITISVLKLQSHSNRNSMVLPQKIGTKTRGIE